MGTKAAPDATETTASTRARPVSNIVSGGGRQLRYGEECFESQPTLRTIDQSRSGLLSRREGMTVKEMSVRKTDAGLGQVKECFYGGRGEVKRKFLVGKAVQMFCVVD